jgi:hypothetical protein
MKMNGRRCAFLTALRSLKAEGVKSTMAAASLGLAVDISGWVTSNIAVGDQVWVIKNCHSPMVLRVANGESHHLVGGCYLHGQMHGENA